MIGGWLFLSIIASLPADDWAVALRARQALHADARLADCNLGVSVRAGVATLWGPVPDAALARDAVARLNLIAGVRSVVDETYVRSTAARPTPAPVAPVIRAAAVQYRDPIAELRPPPTDLAGRINGWKSADARFRRLTVTVRGGEVELAGTVARSADVWEFSDRVRRLPGVTRVVVKATAGE